MTALLLPDEAARLVPGERLVIVRAGDLCVDEGHPDGYECPPECTGVNPPQAWVALTGPCPTCGGDPSAEDHPCVKSEAAHGSHCEHSMTHDVCHWCGIRWGADGDYTCPDCRDGRRIVPLYTAVDWLLDPIDVCQEQLHLACRMDAEFLVQSGWNPSHRLVGRGSIEVVPVVDRVPFAGAFIMVADGEAWLHQPRDGAGHRVNGGCDCTELTLDPLPVRGRDFGILIDCAEVV